MSEASAKSLCAKLADDGAISTKLFKDKPLYWARQDRHEDLSPEQLQDLDRQIQGLREREELLKAEVHLTDSNLFRC
jgi:hypothetical protein